MSEPAGRRRRRAGKWELSQLKTIFIFRAIYPKFATNNVLVALLIELVVIDVLLQKLPGLLLRGCGLGRAGGGS